MSNFRVISLFSAAVMAAGLLAGCGSNTGSTQAAGNAEGGMRTVETDKGTVEIPENPQVIFSDYYLGEFLAVGVKPVIASPYSLSNPFLADYVDGIQEMNGASAETSL